MKKLIVIIGLLIGVSAMSQEYSAKLGNTRVVNGKTEARTTIIKYVPDTLLKGEWMNYAYADSLWKARKATRDALKVQLSAQSLLVQDTTVTIPKLISRTLVLQNILDSYRDAKDETNRWKVVRDSLSKYK